jgi:hypothetical protein
MVILLGCLDANHRQRPGEPIEPFRMPALGFFRMTALGFFRMTALGFRARWCTAR